MKQSSVWVVVLCGVLAACGGGGGGGGGAPAAPPPSSPPPSGGNDQQQTASIDRLVADAESDGAITVFDRSDDIAGTDADTNGIRDDIERYIDSFSLPADRAAAARQVARSLQSAVLADVADRDSLLDASLAMRRAVACLAERSTEALEVSELVRALEAATANTRQRTDRYVAYNDALSGEVLRLPDANACDG